MKLVTLSDGLTPWTAPSKVRIEHTVCDIGGTDRQHQQGWNPQWESNSGDPCEGKRPDCGYCGGIQTGKMPQVQGAQSTLLKVWEWG